MKLKTYELLKVFKILDSFVSLSKIFTTEYKEYVRLYSDGDGKLYFVANNCEDFKIIQNVECDKDVKIDKIYIISELSNIIKNSINYVDLELIDDVIYFTDGKFTLFVVDSMNDEKRDEYFNIEKQNVSRTFVVDGDLEEEIKDIFLLLNLKSPGLGNSYFYENGSLYFNFNELYVKKDSILSFIITDIISLKLISNILLRNKSSVVEYDTLGSKLILKSDNFYVETAVFQGDENSKNYLVNYFENIQEIKTVSLKMEFSNFISAINTFDPESTLTFKNNEVMISSVYRKHVANFNIEDIDNEFIISTEILYKILMYIIKFKNVNNIIFRIIKINDNKFLEFNYNNIKILTEVV